MAGACGFVLSSYMGHSLTIGASASICDLIGALVHYGRSSGSSLIYNQASSGRSVSCCLVSCSGDRQLGARWRFCGWVCGVDGSKPTERERGDHALIAGVCVLASLASLVYAVFVNWGADFRALFR